jgi:DNA ligase (NAD+)
VDFFAEKHNRTVIEKLGNYGVRFPEKAPERGRFTGKVFLFTGGLKSFSREEAKRRIEAEGGVCSTVAGKNVDYVVAGKEPGSKLRRAEELGLKIIDEEEFKRMLMPAPVED